MTPGVTAEMVEVLEEVGIGHDDFFGMETSTLAAKLGVSSHHKLDAMIRQEALFKARAEEKFMSRHGIIAHFISDPDYPGMLRDIADPPTIIYQLGECELNNAHNISIVGTRKCTAYGAGFTKRIVEDLAVYFPDLYVISGLAYGIDACAHTAALSAQRPTVAVVAHGLNMIYPAAHRDLARNIIKNGGALISEYPSNVKPFRKNFLQRNRIVAALSLITLVAETPIKGGAMSTANDAFSYSREVGALPGRAGDLQSEGCNLLIRKNKASLVTTAADIIEITGWHPAGLKLGAKQRSLFPDLTKEERAIYDFVRLKSEPQSVDSIHDNTRLSVATVIATLSEMEFNGIVMRHPGNRYSVSF